MASPMTLLQSTMPFQLADGVVKVVTRQRPLPLLSTSPLEHIWSLLP
jgi:hypothetical protein